MYDVLVGQVGAVEHKDEEVLQVAAASRGSW